MGSSYRLVPEKLLGVDCFAGTGRPTGVYWHPKGDFFAVTGTFEFTIWTGRALTTRLRCRYRVCIYDAKTYRRLAVLDALRWPVNEVAFHPTDPLVAIATGSYDGGYFFEGELRMWNYRTGHHYSPLRFERREVTRCRFSRDGSTLHWLCRPPEEEDSEGNSLENAFFAFRAEIREDADVFPVALEESGFAEPYVRRTYEEVVDELKSIAAAKGQLYEPRWHVWDVTWLGDKEIVTAGHVPTLEHWSSEGHRLLRADVEGVGVQLFLPADERGVLLHRFARSPQDDLVSSRSTLFRYDRTHELTPIFSDRPVFCLSMAASGDLLARAVEWFGSPAQDWVIRPDLVPAVSIGLGRYDLYNHYLRIDGADDLFFLQGTPSESHEHQWVCRMGIGNGRVERLFPLEWDKKRNAHLQSDGGCYIPETLSPALVLAAKIYSPSGFPENGTIICRRRLPDGAVAWARHFNSQVTCMVHLPQLDLVAFALTEGKVGLLDARTGDLFEMQDLQIGGAGTMAMSVASRGTRLAWGTVDGVVVLTQVHPARM